MIKIRNVLLAFLMVLNLISVPVSGESPQPETTEPNAETVETPQESSEEETPEEDEEEEPPETAEPANQPQEEEESEDGQKNESEETEPAEEEPAEETADPEESDDSKEDESVIANEQVITGSDDVFDLHETLPHAAARINQQNAPFLTATSASITSALQETPYFTDQSQLISKGRAAQFDSVIQEGQMEYVSMFFLDDKVCYCVEPRQQVILNNGKGYEFSGHTWQDLPLDQRILCKRIAFFGYGHPKIGTSPAAYVATQLLIWQVVAPEEYEQIYSTLHMCTEPHYQYIECYGSKSIVDTYMKKTMNLVNNYDTVPSFADNRHRSKQYDLEWDETLRLEDTSNVLDWFNDYSEESHNGINIKIDGNTMRVDVDDLYYEGWNTSSGKTLTFKRKESEWENMLAGVLLYECGVQQKLMATTSSDPTPEYQLSFKMKTGNIAVTKLDEYKNTGRFAAGTEFYAGWYEDPETQYQKTGLNDMNWTEYHDPNRVTRNDEDGNSNIQDATRMYYPIMSEDGSQIRRFTVGNDGALRIDGLLPINKKWWIREVKSSDAFDRDDRPWLAETQGQNSTASVSFVNKLRDVKLELTKQDEEDAVTKINDARFIFYEIGDLDLSKNPTEYGTEVNLNRLNTPSMTWRQLKERSLLKVGDSFVFNGYLYEIMEITENQYILKAIKTSEYHPSDTNVFSRYQLNKAPDIGDVIETEEVTSLHATFDPSDDTRGKRSAEITEIRNDSSAVIIHVSETEQKANLLITEETSPSCTDFETAAQEQNVSLSRGNRVTVGRTVYTIKSVNSGSLLVSPDREYDISLSDPAPEWSDIPDARNLKKGDSFTLSYPYSEDGETFEMKEITFSVLQNGPYEMKVEADGQVYSVEAPEWISYEDIPQTTAKEEEFIVEAIKNPVYYVSDSRGNRYEISDHGTQVIETASEKTGDDSSYDGTSEDISYKDVIGGNEIEGGACLDPFDPKGCPVSTVRTKELAKVAAIPYQGPQYDEIDEESRAEGSMIVKDGVIYIVKESDNVSLLLSYSRDGAEYQAEVISGRTTEQAFHTTKINVDFTVEERDEKEIDIRWKTMRYPQNSLSDKATLHLYAYAEEDTQGDLSWQTVSAHLEKGAEFKDANDVVYTVLYADDINRKAVVKSFRGRYEVTPERVTNIMPVTWAEYIAKEEAQGAVFKTNDTFTNPFEQKLNANDVFEIDGIRYVVQAMDTADDGRGTDTLRNGTDYQKKLFYAWDKDATVSADSLNIQDGTVTIDGTAFHVSYESANGFDITGLIDEEGQTVASYISQEVKDSSNRDPYEQQEPVFRVEVDKPEGILYEDAENARYDAKQKGNHVTINGTLYEIRELGKDCVTVVNEAGEQFEITEDGEDMPFTLSQFQEAPIEWVVNDIITVKGENYKILSLSNDPKKGKLLRVKNVSTHKIMELAENPDVNTYETETLVYYRTGNTYTLHLKPGEWGYRLRAENPHIKLNHAEGTWTITSDANATAVLEITDEDNDTIATKTIIFSKTEAEGEVTALPVFAGITGHQYIRITDADNHNMPISGKTVAIFKDEAMKELFKTAVSDSYGAIDVSEFEPGTYWYADPLDKTPRSFTVVSEDLVKGQLWVDGLKWGRTYLAYEEVLPEGYDYGNSEVTHPFTMNAAEGTSTIQATLENRLRRIALKVYKVDQEDHRTLLNNAWFAAHDITDSNTVIDEKYSSTYKEKLKISDIPNDAKAGDIIPVWPAKTNGKKYIYRTEKVLPQEVIVSRMENGKFQGQYHIPVKGYSTTSVMLYQDIVKAMKTPKAGAVFEQIEKEPVSAIRQYKIVSLETEAAEDVFGDLSNTKRVIQASVFDINDSSKTIITVKAVTSDETIGSFSLGEYVSGGILLRSTVTIESLPVTFEDVINSDACAVGDSFKKEMRKTAPMPDYKTVKAALDEGRETITFGGNPWTIRKGEDDCVIVTIHEQSFVLKPETISGAVSWREETTLTINAAEEENGVLKAVTVSDPDGNSWYLSKSMQSYPTTAGKPGAYVSVINSENKTAYEGYTGSDGRIVFTDVAEGDYQVTMDGVTSSVHAEKGTILLPEVKYGHEIQICETRSPLGYMIGNACAVIVPKAEYTVDTVTNTRTNAKIITRKKEIKKIVITRKTGESDE